MHEDVVWTTTAAKLSARRCRRNHGRHVTVSIAEERIRQHWCDSLDHPDADMWMVSTLPVIGGGLFRLRDW